MHSVTQEWTDTGKSPNNRNRYWRMQHLATENSPINYSFRDSGSIWSSTLILCMCVLNGVSLTKKASLSSPAVKTKPKIPSNQPTNHPSRLPLCIFGPPPTPRPLQKTRIFELSSQQLLFWSPVKASNSLGQPNKQYQISIH